MFLSSAVGQGEYASPFRLSLFRGCVAVIVKTNLICFTGETKRHNMNIYIFFFIYECTNETGVRKAFLSGEAHLSSSASHSHFMLQLHNQGDGGGKALQRLRMEL